MGVSEGRWWKGREMRWVRVMVVNIEADTGSVPGVTRAGRTGLTGAGYAIKLGHRGWEQTRRRRRKQTLGEG